MPLFDVISPSVEGSTCPRSCLVYATPYRVLPFVELPCSIEGFVYLRVYKDMNQCPFTRAPPPFAAYNGRRCISCVMSLQSYISAIRLRRGSPNLHYGRNAFKLSRRHVETLKSLSPRMHQHLPTFHGRIRVMRDQCWLSRSNRRSHRRLTSWASSTTAADVKSIPYNGGVLGGHMFASSGLYLNKARRFVP